ncbi:MAG TPA: hypothetical protein VE959_06075 [Bryobacteraceae bacterium]|nr:hypothetical protein [Bryobacteraceae bacterium]
MQFALQVCSYLAAIPLQLLVIKVFLRDAFRRFPFIFAYLIATFLTTAAEMPVYLSFYSGNKASWARLVWLYWLDELILQVLVFAAVISLLYYATAALQTGRILRTSLVAGALVFAAVSFLIHCPPDPLANPSKWMTPWSRDLNLCATILDLALWAVLLASRDKDTRLLMLSGSLGVMFTGEAIGNSLRHLSTGRYSFITAVGDGIVMLSNLLFLFLVWQTFRTEKKPL